MKRIAVGLLSAVVSGSVLMTAGAASAERVDLSVHIDKVNPNPVIVKDGRDTKVTVEIRTTDATRIELRLKPVSDRFRTQSAPAPKIIHQGNLWRFTTSFDESDYEGRWLAIADAYDRHGKKVTDKVTFSVKHEERKADTRLYKFSAGPSSVRKGRSVYFTGRLQFEGHWKGVRNEKVGIYFRSSRSSAWKYVTSDRTDGNGAFRASARAYRSGEYRAVFDGDRRLDDSTSQSDRVRVYG